MLKRAIYIIGSCYAPIMDAQSVDMNENRKVLFVFDSKFSGWKGTQKFFFEFGNYLKKIVMKLH